MVSSQAVYMREYRAKNHDKIRVYEREYIREYKKRLRVKVLALLGNKCANPNCRHLNEDGSLGCKDSRLLHVDHINGGGVKEYKELNRCSRTFYLKILRTNGDGYRLLCAQCNWLRRYEVF